MMTYIINYRSVMLVFLGFLFFSLPAYAQEAASAFSNSGSPIDIVADSLKISENKQQAIFKGQVIAKQDGSTLKSQILEVYYTDRKNETTNKTEQAVKTILAKGKVILLTEDQTASSDWARYDLATEIILMRGNVVVKQPDSTLTGSEFIYDLRNGVSQMTSTSGGRVGIELKSTGSQGN